MWKQKEIILNNKSRGFHLVTNEIVQNLSELKTVSIGLLHIFLKHTSASLTLNENADQSVRVDFESHFNDMVPEGGEYYTHQTEGEDDMPAHIKSSILGNSLSIPISSGYLILGTWQGIYLCEHRNNAKNRKIILTVQGV
jgi:secondary thiamine-phosphate synthase enzyme